MSRKPPGRVVWSVADRLGHGAQFDPLGLGQGAEQLLQLVLTKADLRQPAGQPLTVPGHFLRSDAPTTLEQTTATASTTTTMGE